jgi:hypothetical protein
MLEGFRFFATGEDVDSLRANNPNRCDNNNSNSAVAAEKRFVYYNANAEELVREKMARQHEIDTQNLLQEHANAQADSRYQENLETESKQQLALMLWQKARQFGLRLMSPLSASRNHTDVLLDEDPEHQCSSEFCRFFHLKKGTLFPDLSTAMVTQPRTLRKPSTEKLMELCGMYFEPLVSSGLIYVCWSTGAVHICDQDCSARSVDITDETSGYFCVISGAYKSPILDDMPTGRNIQISRRRIESINKGHLEVLVSRAYRPQHGHQGHNDDADEDDEQPDLEYTAVPAEVASEERLRDKKEEEAEERTKPAETNNETEELASSKVKLDAILVEEENEEEEEEQEHPEDEEIEDGSEDEEKDMMFGKKKKDEIPQDTTDSSGGPPIPKGSAELELGKVKTSNAFELPSDPDARTAHFLKNMEQRQLELTKLVESLLEFQSRLHVWEIQLRQEAERAQSQLQSFRHKHKYRQMTLSEQHIFLTAHVATYTPPMPEPDEPASLKPYCNLITRVWEMMAHSPYVRDYNKQRLIPNLASTALGILYNMTQGPVIEDCSLSVRELPRIPPGLESLDVRNLKIEVIPHGANLGRFLLPLEQLSYLDLKKKKKTQGLRCFKDCLTSTVDLYRRELIEGLKSNPREAVIRYVNACDKLTFG